MFYKKGSFYLITCFCFIACGIFGQEQKIADSLARIYQDKLSDTAKFALLRELSFNEIRDLKKGLAYAEQLITLSKQAGNNTYLRVGYFLKGTKKRLLGNLDEALEAYFKSAEIARKSNYLKGEGQVYAAIADIYSVADNHANAMHYYRRAITALRHSNDSISLASTLSNVGDEFLKSRIYDSALFYFNDAKLVFDRLNYWSGKGYCLGNIGMVYANIGKDNIAEKNIHEAIHILEETQDYYPICVYLISMANIYLNKGDLATALNYTSKSIRLAEQHGLREQIAEGSLKLSDLYERSGNIKEALKYYKKHVAYRDSINNLKTVERMADLRTNYEVSQKQIEVNMLNKEKHNQQTTLIFLFIILGLTIILLGTLSWFYKFKSSEKIRLHQQELLAAKLEIQEQTYRNISLELHDNIGQALSLVKINLNTVDTNDSIVAREKLDDSKNLLTKAIQDLRDISKALNTDFINEIGLTNAVAQQLRLLERTGLFSTELFIKGNIYDYEPHRELLIFRIIQELLNNIVKHAEADKINVSMNYQPEKLCLQVWDNGKGFNIQTQHSSADKGLGLRNIYNRLKMIKGIVVFESEPKKGTTASIEILK